MEIMVTPAVLALRDALTWLDNWRDTARQRLIAVLDTDTYNVPDALTVLNEAHERARATIVRTLAESVGLSVPEPYSDDDDCGDPATL